MKTLVLITSNFPYDTGESFIEAELPWLCHSFDKVIIIAQNISGEKTGNIPGNVSVHRYRTSTSIQGFFYLPVLFILNSEKIISMLRQEVEFRLGTENRLTFRMFFHLFKKIIKACQLKNYISKKLLEEGVGESIFFYSYWLKTGAHAITMLNYRNSIKIARAHGSDIYEEKTGSGYLPLLKYSALQLDAIFFISKQGKQYFEEKTKISNSRFIVSYLGSQKPAIENTEPIVSEKFVIVSCSNMVPLKRIDLIIKALSITEAEKDIIWLHFGEGVMRSALEILAEEKLVTIKRISYRFMGHYPNEELLRYYGSNHVDLFINTSSTEGVPVSIMEAQSFGIPVIATDTGGVREVVSEGTGSLLPVDFRLEDLAQMIGYYAAMKAERVSEIRKNAYHNWESNFNASRNYEDFIMKLNSIFASSE